MKWYDTRMAYRPNEHLAPADRRWTDIDPENTWIISDTHFGHDNIVGFCHRPEDHDQLLVAEWRKVVPDDGVVIHLGDLSYGHNGGDNWFKHIISKELTGKIKYLVRGNHDRKTHNFYKQCGFTLRMPFSWEYRDHIISFSHYPWSEKEDKVPMQANDVRLHGHIHNNGYTRDGYVPFLKQHINMSVEQTKYRPVNLKLLLDAYLFGEYPETTDEQEAAAAERRAIASAK